MSVIFAADRFSRTQHFARCPLGLDDDLEADWIREIVRVASEKYPAARAAITARSENFGCNPLEIYFSCEKLRQMGHQGHSERGHVYMGLERYELEFVPDELSGGAA